MTWDPKASRDALRAAVEQFLVAISAVDQDSTDAMVEERDAHMRGWMRARLYDALDACRVSAQTLHIRLRAVSIVAEELGAPEVQP